MTQLATLRDLHPIAFDGADAASFLHGQLSSDVEGMAVGAAGWTSYNSPKGRVLATMLLWRRAPDSFVAFAAADLADALRQRLAMFVLRAKVKVAELPGRVVGSAEHPAAGREHATTPDGRYLLVAPDTDSGGDETAARPWHWLGVRAGVPMITAATQDQFIAQTLNLDLIGAISFRKGCYPGQEIVARMQYLGRLKERLLAFHVDASAPPAATRIHAADDAVGTVINAAPAPSGGSDLLAVVRWEAAERDLRVEGAALAPLELPYAVPAPTRPNRVDI